MEKELIKRATEVAIEKKLSEQCVIGQVGSALITDKGNIYVGTCLDCGCGIGFCAEVSAIASMTTSGESKIKTIVAVGSDGKILSPCGKCRELMMQINPENKEIEVILENKVLKLKDLLPEYWFNKN